MTRRYRFYDNTTENANISSVLDVSSRPGVEKYVFSFVYMSGLQCHYDSGYDCPAVAPIPVF